METIYIHLEKPPKGMDQRVRCKGGRRRRTGISSGLRAELKAKPLDEFSSEATPAGEAGIRLPPHCHPPKRIDHSLASDRPGLSTMPDISSRPEQLDENILTSAEARGSKFRFFPADEKGHRLTPSGLFTFMPRAANVDKPSAETRAGGLGNDPAAPGSEIADSGTGVGRRVRK